MSTDRHGLAGQTGEIVVRPTRPNTMMQGYFRDDERAVEDTRNQWIHTGDIGSLDEDGYLHFVANRDNSIYRGRIAGRISSLEIESVLETSPDIDAAAVIGLTNETGGEDIKAIVVPAAGAYLTPVDVCKHCERELPYLKVPRFIELRESLPRSPTGKIQLSKLQDEGTHEAWDREIGYDLSR